MIRHEHNPDENKLEIRGIRDTGIDFIDFKKIPGGRIGLAFNSRM